MENNDYNSFTYSDEDEEIRLSSLIKKMMSHTKLMLFTVIIFVILSFVYGKHRREESRIKSPGLPVQGNRHAFPLL